jgi:hypothetical protein
MKVFGKWSETELKPVLDGHIQVVKALHSLTRQHFWHPFRADTLLGFWIFRLLQNLRKHHPQGYLHDKDFDMAMEHLASEPTIHVLNSVLELPEALLSAVLEGMSRCVRELVDLGGALVVDDSIWASWSHHAHMRGKLVHIKDKPHPHGELVFILSQRLHFSGLPIALAFAPTFLGRSHTPLQAVTSLRLTLDRIGFEPQRQWLLISDSAWAYPSYIV